MANLVENLGFIVLPSNCKPFRLSYFCPLMVAVVLLSGCAWTVSGKNLQKELTRQATVNRDLEEKLAGLQLLLLEEEAQGKELEKKLEEAVLEVVRAKEKLRSMESRAEAASTLAEGEIALKALKKNTAGVEREVEILQAEELLKASNLELEKENYGGALYLATRAKVIINEGQQRSKDREKTPMVAGEVPFAIPLQLRAVSPSNVREEPGLDSKVLFSLQKGSVFVGYSYKGLWVRVGTGDGRGGWIHYSLVGGR